MLAGTVLKLGTRQHHDVLLGPIDSLDATGCFALTELGFGMYLALTFPLAFSPGMDNTCCNGCASLQSAILRGFPLMPALLTPVDSQHAAYTRHV